MSRKGGTPFFREWRAKKIRLGENTFFGGGRGLRKLSASDQEPSDEVTQGMTHQQPGPATRRTRSRTGTTHRAAETG